MVSRMPCRLLGWLLSDEAVCRFPCRGVARNRNGTLSPGVPAAAHRARAVLRVVAFLDEQGFRLRCELESDFPLGETLRANTPGSLRDFVIAETYTHGGEALLALEAIKAKDPDLFKQRIETMRAACTACHAAEAHPFIKIGVPTVRRNPVVND